MAKTETTKIVEKVTRTFVAIQLTVLQIPDAGGTVHLDAGEGVRTNNTELQETLAALCEVRPPDVDHSASRPPLLREPVDGVGSDYSIVALVLS